MNMGEHIPRYVGKGSYATFDFDITVAGNTVYNLTIHPLTIN